MRPGGLLPILKVGHRRYAVESSVWLLFVWFRVQIRVEFTR